MYVNTKGDYVMGGFDVSKLSASDSTKIAEMFKNFKDGKSVSPKNETKIGDLLNGSAKNFPGLRKLTPEEIKSKDFMEKNEALLEFLKSGVRNKDAREKLGKIKASNDITYDEAKNLIKQIENKYEEDIDPFNGGKYHKKVEDSSPTNSEGFTLAIYRYHYELDPNMIPEPDKTDYLRAKSAIKEIETQNSALVADAYGRYGS